MSSAGLDAAPEAPWSGSPFSSSGADPANAAGRPRPSLEPLEPGPAPGKRPPEEAPATLEACALSARRLLRPPNRTEPLLGMGQLSAAGEAHPERGVRPLPPLPPEEEEEEEEGRLAQEEEEQEEADREVEFLTSSDTDRLLGHGACRASAQGHRGCGQVNHAYSEAAPGMPADETSPGDSPEAGTCPPSVPPPPPPPHRLHRRLRRSHSGPAGSFHKPAAAVRASDRFRQASPTSDDEAAKPEVPPRAPIPARALKPDYRRWSAEVASGAYSDEDKPPKVPPREPLFRGDSRTPSPKSLPSYLHGVMPPTQSFAPDPKYVSTKALQRQQSEGAAPRGPCILPIIEKGRKVSSTHYYLLPERPPYLDKYEKFFQEAKEADPVGDIEAGGDGRPWREREAGPVRLAPALRAELGAPIKRKHFPCVVSP